MSYSIQLLVGWEVKPNVDDSQRPERANHAKENVLLFSPHPDNDVISMMGKHLLNLQTRTNIHVAYQTSGNTVVWDDDVPRFIVCRRLSKLVALDNQKVKNIYKDNVEIFEQKKPNQIDTEFVRKVKLLSKKVEAIAEARFVELNENQIHFQNLPFYDRRRFDKSSSYEDDIQQTIELLRKVKPHQVFTTGDFEDPYGTHKMH